MKERLKKATIDKYLAIIVIIALAFVPFVANLYSTQILGKFITYMIAALALDILWGYGGLMNLGFAVFFGMGGYIVGISLACQDGLSCNAYRERNFPADSHHISYTEEAVRRKHGLPLLP